MPDKKEQRLLDERIMDSIRTMPEVAPPHDFVGSVMAELEPKHPTLWMRLKLWLTEPKHVVFTPVRLVPILATVMVVIGLGLFTYFDNAPSAPSVRFVLSDPGMNARSVAVIGSFNNWRADQAVMRFDQPSGVWVLEMALPPGDHEYMFLVDGMKLLVDPNAQMTRDDGFGNRNSIVFVNGSNEQAL